MDSFIRDFSAIGMPSLWRTSSPSTMIQRRSTWAWTRTTFVLWTPRLPSQRSKGCAATLCTVQQLPSATPWDEASFRLQRVVVTKPSPPQLDMRAINRNSICVSWKHSQSRLKWSGYNVGVSKDDFTWSSSLRASALGWCPRWRAQNPWPRFQWAVLPRVCFPMWPTQ